MDTHLLRTFVTVARLGSFSAAAAELQYTQAAVSQQIAALELAAPGDPLPLLDPLSAVGVSEEEVAVVLPPDHPLATRAGASLAGLADARWIDAPDAAPPLSDIRRVARIDGFRPTLNYTGTDVMSLIALATAGHGLTVLPTRLAAAANLTVVPVREPRIVHRIELVHGTVRAGSPAAALAALL